MKHYIFSGGSPGKRILVDRALRIDALVLAIAAAVADSSPASLKKASEVLWLALGKCPASLLWYFKEKLFEQLGEALTDALQQRMRDVDLWSLSEPKLHKAIAIIRKLCVLPTTMFDLVTAGQPNLISVATFRRALSAVGLRATFFDGPKGAGFYYVLTARQDEISTDVSKL